MTPTRFPSPSQTPKWSVSAQNLFCGSYGFRAVRSYIIHLSNTPALQNKIYIERGTNRGQALIILTLVFWCARENWDLLRALLGSASATVIGPTHPFFCTPVPRIAMSAQLLSRNSALTRRHSEPYIRSLCPSSALVPLLTRRSVEVSCISLIRSCRFDTLSFIPHCSVYFLCSPFSRSAAAQT